MITAQEEKLMELENLCEPASEELEKTAELMDKVLRLYDELISYADLYDLSLIHISLVICPHSRTLKAE